jgi:hypothetical protein
MRVRCPVFTGGGGAGLLACLWMEQMQLCILPDLMRGLNSKTRCGEVIGVAGFTKGKLRGLSFVFIHLSNWRNQRAKFAARHFLCVSGRFLDHFLGSAHLLFSD